MKARIGVVGAGTYGSVLINAYYGAHKRAKIWIFLFAASKTTSS